MVGREAELAKRELAMQQEAARVRRCAGCAAVRRSCPACVRAHSQMWRKVHDAQAEFHKDRVSLTDKMRQEMQQALQNQLEEFAAQRRELVEMQETITQQLTAVRSARNGSRNAGVSLALFVQELQRRQEQHIGELRRTRVRGASASERARA